MKVKDILHENQIDKLLKLAHHHGFSREQIKNEIIFKKSVKYDDKLFTVKYVINPKTESWVLNLEDADGEDLKELSAGESLETLSKHLSKKHHVYKRQLQNL